MSAGRVLVTQQARDAAKQLLALTGPVKEQVRRVVQHGGILADPHHWNSPLAGKWRHDWGPDVNQLNQAVAKLDELDHRAQQVVEDIFKADDISPGTGMPNQPPSDPLDDILNNYQVADDEMVKWEPPWPFSMATKPEKMTRTEAQLLGLLSPAKMWDFKGVRDDAFSEAEKRYPVPHPGPPTREERNDGHMDSFRHAYWNALMASKFKEDFATKFGTAHEGVPGNPADQEAMDLHNNEVGRRIAREHPDAGPKELANLVQQAVERGEMVVIDGNNELAWSNQVPVGKHGKADDPPRGGARPAEPGDSGDVSSRGAGS
ncbi:MAG: DUF6973 domain-containing protein [Pseudonocardiaceae bacterium]